MIAHDPYYTCAIRLRLVAILVLGLSVLIGKAVLGTPSKAQEPPDVNVRQEDLDGDGRPDLAVITTSLATDRDVVWIYDGARDMPWGDTWQHVADFENDTTWIWSNIGRSRPDQPVDFLLWPYLATSALENPKSIGSDLVLFGAAIPQTLRYLDAPSVVAVNLRGGKISLVAFSGYPVEAGFHVNTEQYSLKGETDYADFEVAQAYYDLAQEFRGVQPCAIASTSWPLHVYHC